MLGIRADFFFVVVVSPFLKKQDFFFPFSEALNKILVSVAVNCSLCYNEM